MDETDAGSAAPPIRPRHYELDYTKSTDRGNYREQKI
jgi:hypothetical protein